MNLKIKLLSTVAIALYFFTGCNSATTTGESQTDTAASQSMPMTTDSTTKMDNMQMDNAMMGAMNAMMSKMSGMKMTGDFDMDFANMMIEHHQGAIEMAQAEITDGKDEKIKAMARQIITKQKEEQQKLRDFVNSYKPSGMKHGEGELEKSMSDMESKMKSMQMTGDTDKDFASMMIHHHEKGIAMSEKELKNGMSNKLKQMAQNMIADSEKDIKKLKDLLNNPK